MIVVPAIELLLGMLVVGLVVLRAAWLVMHPAAHHAMQGAGYWSAQTDRVMQNVSTHSHG